MPVRVSLPAQPDRARMGSGRIKSRESGKGALEQKDEWGMFQELTEGGRNGIMKKGDKAAIVCCSNALPHSFAGRLKELECFLEEMGLRPVRSNCIFEKKSV